MTSVERACKTISNLVRRAPIESAGLLGLEDGGGSINVQGEEQKKLDIITNTVPCLAVIHTFHAASVAG